ncbi:cytochrome P450 [Actinomadura atramentaria]|uniref:cytochrome P450 n=1 Tax=Actinomadura atramentaria TaxID=1990 RepID=UPI000381298C|nr:cytochrome P450 [Actinomadura atramentaria]
MSLPPPPGPRDDPWQYYAAVRELGPVVRSDAGTYLVARYDAAVEALTTPGVGGTHPFRATRQVFGPNLLDTEGARHRALRRAVAPEFRARTVAGYGETLVRPVVERAVDALVDRGPVDAVAAFAAVVPARVVAGVLGIPAARAAEVYAALGPVIRYLDRPAGNLAAALAARDRLDERIAGLVRGHRAETGLLARLLREAGHGLDERGPIGHGAAGRGSAERELAGHGPAGGGLDERGPAGRGLANHGLANHGLDERGLVRLVLLLIAAGTETTVRALGNLLLALLAEPGRLAALRADRSLVGPAVEETLRRDPPLHSTLRFATEDAVIGGVEVPAGAVLHVLLAGANRDDRAYAAPDRWDPGRWTRGAPRALTFGFGAHLCLGLPLARLELTTALDVLLDRTSDVRLAGPPGPVEGGAFRGPRALPIEVRSRTHRGRPAMPATDSALPPRAAPVVAHELTADTLDALLRRRLAAIHVRGFFPADAARAAAARALDHPELGNYHKAKSGSVGRVFTPHVDTAWDPERVAEYHRAAPDSTRASRALFAPYPSPIDRLRLLLEELWPGGARLLTLRGQPCFVGALRVFRPGGSQLFPHNDRIDQETDAPEIAGIREQLTANVYLATPERGGELHLWLREPTEAERAVIVEVEGLEPESVGPAALTFRPAVGDLIMFSSVLLHAVAAAADEPRVGTAAFIASRGPAEPLLYWS